MELEGQEWVMEPLKERIALAKEERRFFEELWCWQSNSISDVDTIPFKVVQYMNYLTDKMNRETEVIKRLRGKGGK